MTFGRIDGLDYGRPPERCGCDESLALAKRLDIALEALDAIQVVLRDVHSLSIPQIATIVSLARSSLERVKP